MVRSFPPSTDDALFSIELVVIAAMICFNSVFAAFEIALASVGQSRLQSLVRDQRTGAAAALRMKTRMEASLAVVQLGITLVGATAAATSGAGAGDLIEPFLIEHGVAESWAELLAIVLVVAPLTVVTIIVGELVPKVYALRNQEWVCLKLSPGMEWFSVAVWPAVWFLETVVQWIMNLSPRAPGDRDGSGDQATILELRSAAALARMSRVIGHREEGIIVSASRLATTPLRRIMVPAEYMGMLSMDHSLSDALVVAHQEMHTRFPVTERANDAQRIVGYVNFKDIVAAVRIAPRDPSLKSLVRSLRRFRADQSVSEALETMIREHAHIALVTEKDDFVAGMITLEDIVEELVGEIHDEFDRIPSFLNRVGRGWIAGGFVPLARIREETGIELVVDSEKPIYTLSDWITAKLDRPPRGGDRIEAGDYEVIIRKVRHILVQEAYLGALSSSKTTPPSA